MVWSCWSGGKRAGQVMGSRLRQLEQHSTSPPGIEVSTSKTPARSAGTEADGAMQRRKRQSVWMVSIQQALVAACQVWIAQLRLRHRGTRVFDIVTTVWFAVGNTQLVNGFNLWLSGAVFQGCFEDVDSRVPARKPSGQSFH